MLETINQADSTFVWHVRYPIIDAIAEDELLSAWRLAESFAKLNEKKFNSTIESILPYKKEIPDKGLLVGIEVIYKKISTC